MKLSTKILAGLGTVGVAALLAHPALAQATAAAAPASPIPPATVDKGDNTWMLVSTLLVLMMSIPGLALFYGGLVRTKNMLSVLTQVLMIVCMVGLIWVCWGYSETFTGLNQFVGNPFTKLFLKGVDSSAKAATFSNGVYIPELTYVLFQMTFAMITPALIIGSFAERVKFWPLMLFVALWVTLVYFPVAHMVWYWGGPDVMAAAAIKGGADLDAASLDSGWLFYKGALDFAGGTVVHINAGIAGLMGCLVIGKRLGFPNEPMPPHSLTMTMIGASLLWVGWFGFNAGSNLEASSIASVAFMNTMIATAAAGFSWMVVEQIVRGKASLLGCASGVVAGLVAVTPASGYAGTMGSVVLGLMVSPICFFFVSVVKRKFGYDDSLDVFGVHCVGGITGAIMTGFLDNPNWGGQGIADYTSKPGTMVAGTYDMWHQVWVQCQGVLTTLIWSGVISLILFFVIDKVFGLRVTPEVEHEGLDIAEHGERAYHH